MKKVNKKENKGIRLENVDLDINELFKLLSNSLEKNENEDLVYILSKTEKISVY